MIYAKKKKKSEHLSKYSSHIDGKRSGSSTKSAMINTQGNTLQGCAMRKKKIHRRGPERLGGNIKKHPQTKEEKRKKKYHFILSHAKGWRHLWGFLVFGFFWWWWFSGGAGASGRRARPSSRLGSVWPGLHRQPVRVQHPSSRCTPYGRQ